MPAISKSKAWLKALHREFAIKIEQVGIVGAFRLAILKLVRKLSKLVSLGKQEVHPFDIKYGTDTSGIVEIGNLDLEDNRLKHAVRYQTAIVEVFLAMLGDLPISHEHFVFIDVGSGKGRALLLATRFPFSAIIGVELSPNLHAVACQNIKKFDKQSNCSQRVSSVCADAGTFELPLENLILYFFNPFDDIVMREVAANVKASLTKKPRQIYILYLKPECRHIWDNLPLLECFTETTNYVIYRTHPATS